MNLIRQQQQQMPPVDPLYIIKEDLTAEELRKAYLLSTPIRKILIEIKEKRTDNTFRVSLRWFNDGECQPKLYADLTDLVASHLKCHSLDDDTYALNLVKQNMVMRYLDDEDELVTIRSWPELAHAACHIMVKEEIKLPRFRDEDGKLIKPVDPDTCRSSSETNLLKLMVEFPKNISLAKVGKVRVINVSKTGASIQCGGFLFKVKKNSVGVLYFVNDSRPILRVYSNMGKASDFIRSQPLARTYLFIHRLERDPLIFARHYPKGVFGIHEWQRSDWASQGVVRLRDLPKTWSSYEKKCGKGNVRLSFISPMKYKEFYMDDSRDSSVILETRHGTRPAINIDVDGLEYQI